MPPAPPRRFTVIIPCRPGSQGVKGKNYVNLNGRPLVCHAIESALANPRVGKIVVWTNDQTVRGVVEARYSTVEVWDRPEWTDASTATIDDLVEELIRMGQEWFAVLQPTLVPSNVFLGEALKKAENRPRRKYTVTTPVEGLLWVDGLPVSPRANRQWAEEAVVNREVGLRVVTGESDWQDLQVDMAENSWVDIDEPVDLEYARALARRRLIVAFNLVASETLGYGHLYRCMEIASEMQDETVVFLGDIDSRARKILADRGWEYLEWGDGYSCDVMVVDRLDTGRVDMARYTFNSRRVVTFENRGEGTRLADAVINDMYGLPPFPLGSRVHTETGYRWVVLRPEFRGLPPYEVRNDIERVLVTFGGTDPSGMTEWAGVGLAWVPGIEVRVVKPPGRDVEFPDDTDVVLIENPNMAAEMRKADVVVCSAGRTLYEVAAVGVPAVTVTQNERERKHRGLHDIGRYLGPAHKGVDILGALNDLRERRVREDMSREIQSLIDGRGVERIVRLIRQLGLD